MNHKINESFGIMTDKNTIKKLLIEYDKYFRIYTNYTQVFSLTDFKKVDKLLKKHKPEFFNKFIEIENTLYELDILKERGVLNTLQSNMNANYANTIAKEMNLFNYKLF